MLTRAFRAMGTDVVLVLDAVDSPVAGAALDDAEAAFTEIEELCTRFARSSELSRLNEERTRRVPPLLAEIVEGALAGREATGGLFDPTVHDAVVAAGYDRSFPELGERPAVAGPTPRCGGEVTVRGDVIELGPGVRLDLGGIAKGVAVDRACELLTAVGPCLVDAGGDIRVAGTWPVAVDGGPTLELTDAAVATSGRDRRTWRRDAGEAHHLIDPSTSQPAATRTLRATVVAPTAAEAEVLAKAAFLGADVPVPHVIIHDDGAVHLGGALA